MVGTLSFEDIEDIRCFTPGTMIATPKGEVEVEKLSVGSKVITHDHGVQTIRWIGRRELDSQDMEANEEFRAIRIKAGALGNGLPVQDLVVSPQHRVLLEGDLNELYFGERDVLVAAKHLIGMEGVERVGAEPMTYIHLMFDAHEIVLSNGSWSESFQPSDALLTAEEQDVRDELLTLFPELGTIEGLSNYTAARRSLKAFEAKALLA